MNKLFKILKACTVVVAVSFITKSTTIINNNDTNVHLNKVRNAKTYQEWEEFLGERKTTFQELEIGENIRDSYYYYATGNLRYTDTASIWEIFTVTGRGIYYNGYLEYALVVSFHGEVNDKYMTHDVDPFSNWIISDDGWCDYITLNFEYATDTDDKIIAKFDNWEYAEENFPLQYLTNLRGCESEGYYENDKMYEYVRSVDIYARIKSANYYEDGDEVEFNNDINNPKTLQEIIDNITLYDFVEVLDYEIILDEYSGNETIEGDYFVILKNEGREIELILLIHNIDLRPTIIFDDDIYWIENDMTNDDFVNDYVWAYDYQGNDISNKIIIESGYNLKNESETIILSVEDEGYKIYVSILVVRGEFGGRPGWYVNNNIFVYKKDLLIKEDFVQHAIRTKQITANYKTIEVVEDTYTENYDKEGIYIYEMAITEEDNSVKRIRFNVNVMEEVEKVNIIEENKEFIAGVIVALLAVIAINLLRRRK